MKVNNCWSLMTVSLLAIAATAVSQEAAFRHELNRYFQGGPAPLTEGEQEQLDETRSKLDVLRRQLLEQAQSLTEERFREITAEIEPLLIIVTRLEDKHRQWMEFTANHPAGVLAAGSAPDDLSVAPIDVNEFYVLQNSFVSLRVAQGYKAPNGMDPNQWTQLADRYWAFSNKSFSSDQYERAAYLLRARYMSCLCRLRGAALSYNAGDHAGTRLAYRRAIKDLQAVHRMLRAITYLATKPELIEELPAAPEKYENMHIAGAESWFEHDLRTNPNLEVEAATQISTSKAVTRLLEAVCPWGVETFMLLDEAGTIRNFEFNVLRSFAWKEGQKLAICAPSPVTVPKFIRDEMESVRTGVFKCQGETVSVDWATVPDEASYSLWMASPQIFDMTPSAVFTSIAAMATFSQFGLLDIGATFVGGALGAALAEDYGADCPVAVAVGVAPDAMIHDIKTEDLKLKRTGLSSGKLAKGIGIQALAVLEEMELKDLFEGYNLTSDSAKAFVGDPITYAGKPVPPIILRAFIVGIEKVLDDEYRRIRVITKYWRLDPRGLVKYNRRYDLTKSVQYASNAIAAYLNGDEPIQRSIWKSLPDSTGKPIGTRIAITDLTPSRQRLTIEIPQDTWEDWNRNLPDGKALVAALDSRLSEKPGQVFGEFENGRALLSLYDPARYTFEQPYAWQPTKILTEYPVRIVEVDKQSTEADDSPTYDLDPTRAVEKGRFVARFRGSRGRKPSGEVSSIEYDGQIIALNHVFKGDSPASRTGPIVEFEGDLLPKKLFLDHVIAGKDVIVKSYNDHVEIKGAAGPAPVGWHRFEIAVDGERKYHAYGLVESLGAAAAFAAKVPLSVGRHTIVVSTDGFDPVSISVVREPPRPGNVNVAARQAAIIEYSRKRDSEPRGSRAYWDNHFKMLSSKMSLAGEYCEIERFTDARAILEGVEMEIPRGPMPHPSLADRAVGIHKDLMYRLPEICYRLGEVKTMAQAGKWRIDQEIAEQLRDVQSGSDPPKYLLYKAYELAEFIERCILLDADSVMGAGFIAGLDAQHQDLLKRAGVFDSQYDGKYMFRYGQEVGL